CLHRGHSLPTQRVGGHAPLGGSRPVRLGIRKPPRASRGLPSLGRAPPTAVFVEQGLVGAFRADPGNGRALHDDAEQRRVDRGVPGASPASPPAGEASVPASAAPRHARVTSAPEPTSTTSIREREAPATRRLGPDSVAVVIVTWRRREPLKALLAA